MTFILGLKSEAKAIILDALIKKINRSGKIYGCNQIIDMLEEEAISLGYVKCPYCGCEKRK